MESDKKSLKIYEYTSQYKTVTGEIKTYKKTIKYTPSNTKRGRKKKLITKITDLIKIFDQETQLKIFDFCKLISNN